MSVDEGCEYFENISNIKTKLLTLKKVGLGYIKIGQQATTLSGGEAQRIKLAKELSVILIISLFEKKTSGFYHNTSIVINEIGKIISKYRKMHIPDDPGYYEKFYFTPGDLGFKSVKTKFGKIGPLICWDQWFPEAARLTALKGAQIIFYPTAIGWHPKEKKKFGKSFKTSPESNGFISYWNSANSVIQLVVCTKNRRKISD